MSHASALCADREGNVDPVRHRGKDWAKTPDLGHDRSRQERTDSPWTVRIGIMRGWCTASLKAAAAKLFEEMTRLAALK